MSAVLRLTSTGRVQSSARRDKDITERKERAPERDRVREREREKDFDDISSFMHDDARQSKKTLRAFSAALVNDGILHQASALLFQNVPG